MCELSMYVCACSVCAVYTWSHKPNINTSHFDLLLRWLVGNGIHTNLFYSFTNCNLLSICPTLKSVCVCVCVRVGKYSIIARQCFGKKSWTNLHSLLTKSNTIYGNCQGFWVQMLLTVKFISFHHLIHFTTINLIWRNQIWWFLSIVVN